MRGAWLIVAGLAGCAGVSPAPAVDARAPGTDAVALDTPGPAATVAPQDDPAASPPRAWYRDADGDGWGDPSAVTRAAACPAGHVPAPGDCDDADPATHPSAAEVCGGGDEDCDGVIDESDALGAVPAFLDGDGDGYGDPAIRASVCARVVPWVADASDCDDARADVHPGAREVCDGETDEDCDGLVDEPGARGAVGWYVDADADGYGDPAGRQVTCVVPAAAAATAEDCDDARASVHPDATEQCGTGLDEDCDGATDCADTDCLGAPACVESTCDDGVDDDADGLVDCEDADCAGAPACVESTCDDGLDDDTDGLVDCDDDDCWGRAACDAVVRVTLDGGTVAVSTIDGPGSSVDWRALSVRGVTGHVAQWASSATSSCTFTMQSATFSGAVDLTAPHAVPLRLRTPPTLSTGCGIDADFLPETLVLAPGGTRSASFEGRILPWYGGPAGGRWSTSYTFGFTVQLSSGQAATFAR